MKGLAAKQYALNRPKTIYQSEKGKENQTEKKKKSSEYAGNRESKTIFHMNMK